MKLKDAARTAIVIDRQKFKLTLYQREREDAKFHKAREYPIAVGAEGFATPHGLYVINTRAKHPEWLVPDSQWAVDAGLTPGTVVEGGAPENPLKERWLGITEPEDGVGIHGTEVLDSLGSKASHGCIRMDPDDVTELFDLVPKGTVTVIL